MLAPRVVVRIFGFVWLLASRQWLLTSGRCLSADASEGHAGPGCKQPSSNEGNLLLQRRGPGMHALGMIDAHHELQLCAPPDAGRGMWPDMKNDVYCDDCTALVLTGPYGGRCDQYCQSFGHECVAAAEEIANDCQVKSTQRCDVQIRDTSDMLCTCMLPKSPGKQCASFQDWPGVERSCNDCTALVEAYAFEGRCDQYCASFGHVCTAAAEEKDETCGLLYTSRCDQQISGTSDMLCTCERPGNASAPQTSTTTSTTVSLASPWPKPPTVPVGSSLLAPLDVGAPDTLAFIPKDNIYLKPGFTSVQGAKQTNKFWANWAISERGSFRGDNRPIFPMPYTLLWKSQNDGSRTDRAELCLSHGTPNYHRGNLGNDHYKYFNTPIACEIALGAQEQTTRQGHKIVEESLFGIHLEVHGSGGQAIRFPILSGMAYLSGHYRGGFTPKVTAGHRGLSKVELLRDGIWLFCNSAGKQFRVYVLDDSGNLLPSSQYHFSSHGELNRPLQGWIRVAEMISLEDAISLDEHARAILTDITLDVPSAGQIYYNFTKAGSSDVPVLHYAYAHHLKLMRTQGREPALKSGLSPSQTPSKGMMRGIVGDSWDLRVDITSAAALDYLPHGDLSDARKEEVAAEVLEAMRTFETPGWHNWRPTMFKGDYYFGGKGYQKVATVCLLLAKLHPGHEKIEECVDILEHGYRCLFEPSIAGDCDNAPKQAYYDKQWGGVVSSSGFENDAGCKGQADFGNACYNDHHYHFGYFVTSAAILARLRPSFQQNHKFINYVNTLIRDTTNPSKEDSFFPQFRSFDWFDLHSWSRGVAPNGDGKDQESTSEELNLLYGIHLWGEVTGNTPLKQLGETMLSLDVMTIKEFFLMTADNPHYHPEFSKNRVTGIFFQNKVDYTTWFGSRKAYIHGIQMLPLSPALQLTRDKHFCQQEWDDVLKYEDHSIKDKWSSVVFTGNLAIIDPNAAYAKLRDMHATKAMDDGLTKAWAMYWTAVQPH